MTWQVARVSGSIAQPSANTWRVARVGGTAGATWQVTRIAGAVSRNTSTWQLARVSGAAVVGWRVARVSGLVSLAAVPVVQGPTAKVLDPVRPVTVTATTTNGVVPDSWAFHLGSTAGGADLDARILSNTGGTVTFKPPGRFNGATIYLTVTATFGSQTSAPATVTYPVRKGSVFTVVQQTPTADAWVTESLEGLVTESGEQLMFMSDKVAFVVTSAPATVA